LLLVTAGTGGFAIAFRASLAALYRGLFGAENVVEAITGQPRWMRLVVPLVAAAAAGTIARWWAPRTQGVSNVMEAIALGRVQLSLRSTASRVASSWVAIAGGLSIGREVPLIEVGGSLGTAVGRSVQIQDGTGGSRAAVRAPSRTAALSRHDRRPARRRHRHGAAGGCRKRLRAALGAGWSDLGVLGASSHAGGYALVGMAAATTASIHAPLTAAVMVFELPGDYLIALPLILATVVATATSKWLGDESVYETELRKRGLAWQITLEGRQLTNATSPAATEARRE
jgi:H+/Cl- antiporter ClcA